ncbi:amidohydrolase family protein [Neorhizobium sp. DT-125]|uniref:amidohydrolase family protein n=1 Tax=Neorhizobium sp. DT-125 TaxID=3396163 RepID=UPI003F1E2325
MAPPEELTDCHVHIFGTSRAMAVARYPHPEEEATLANIEKIGGKLGIRRYVLTQPSFLGFDNCMLLSALAARPDTLRGVVWLDNSWDQNSLPDLATKGVAGLRFPLKYSADTPDWPSYSALFSMAARTAVHVELGLGGPELVKAMHFVLGQGAQVVIAHLGMFDPDLGPDRDPTFGAILEAGQTRQVWVKLSAPYRSTAQASTRACERLLEKFGPERLVWGSDWPHVGPRLDRKTTYEMTFSWFKRIVKNDEVARQILVTSPEHLYRFKPR